MLGSMKKKKVNGFPKVKAVVDPIVGVNSVSTG